VLFVKPMALVPPTNMTVITTRRRYNFELISASGRRAARGVIFAMRFRYPYEQAVEVVAASPPPLSVTPPDQWNRTYSFDGSAENIPEEVFDDGVSTFLRFGKSTMTPAIFAIQPDKQESLVNFAMRGDYVVIDRIARQFVLRQGKVVTNLYNDALKSATPGPEAPTQRDEPAKRRGLFGR
jgi:type IV secretion system protein VirB9